MRNFLVNYWERVGREGKGVRESRKLRGIQKSTTRLCSNKHVPLTPTLPDQSSFYIKSSKHF